MGLFTALADSSFVRNPQGRLLYYPWGSAGRGYQIRSDEEYLRLRGENAWLMRIGILGLPAVASITVERFGILPIVCLALLVSAAYLLWIVWSTRGLAPTEERISRAEARARIADALSARSIRWMIGFFSTLAALGFGLYLGGGSADFLAVGAAMALTAGLLGGAASWFKRRFGRRSA